MLSAFVLGGGGGDPSSAPTCGPDDPCARLSLAGPAPTARAPAVPPTPPGSPRDQPRTGMCVPRGRRRDDMSHECLCYKGGREEMDDELGLCGEDMI